MQRTCATLGAQHSGLDALGADEAQQLFDLLARVRAAAGDFDPDAPDGAGRGTPIRCSEAEANWAKEGWVDGPWFRAAFSTYRVADLIRRSNDGALGPLQLTHVRHEALAVLCFSQAGEMPMGRLSEHLFVHPTSVTSTVDTLERLGYVRRVPHPTDRRATLARITPAGRRRRHHLDRGDGRRPAAGSVRCRTPRRRPCSRCSRPVRLAGWATLPA